MTLQLADRTTRLPLGIVEDVPLQVGDIIVPCDFVIVDMEEDPDVPIILGRPFLATAGVFINCRNGKILLKVGENSVEFEVEKAMKAPSQVDSCFMIEGLDEIVQETFEASYADTQCLTFDEQEESWESYAIDQGEEQTQGVRELSLSLDSNGSSELERIRLNASPDPPKLELKPLPSNLRYRFLGPNNTYPVIVSAGLNEEHKKKFLDEMRAHCKATGYSTDDFKRIDSARFASDVTQPQHPSFHLGAAIPEAPQQQQMPLFQGYEAPPFKPYAQPPPHNFGASSSSAPPPMQMQQEFDYAAFCASLHDIARLSIESLELGRCISDKVEKIEKEQALARRDINLLLSRQKEEEETRKKVNEMYEWLFPRYGPKPDDPAP